MINKIFPMTAPTHFKDPSNPRWSRQQLATGSLLHQYGYSG